MKYSDIAVYIFIIASILICMKDFPEFLLVFGLGMIGAYVLGNGHD
jgi:hypothetical protein